MFILNQYSILDKVITTLNVSVNKDTIVYYLFDYINKYILSHENDSTTFTYRYADDLKTVIIEKVMTIINAGYLYNSVAVINEDILYLSISDYVPDELTTNIKLREKKAMSKELKKPVYASKLVNELKGYFKDNCIGDDVSSEDF